MFKVLTGVIVAAFTCSAYAAPNNAIPAEYQGTWISKKPTKKSCDRENEENYFSGGWLKISKSRIEGLELGCDVRKIQSKPAGGIEVIADCSSEGETFKETFKFNINGSQLTSVTGAVHKETLNKCK